MNMVNHNSAAPGQAKPLRSPAALRIPASLVSVLFHPLFFPLLLTCLVYILAPVSFAAVPREVFMRWMAMIAINTLLLPLVVVLILKRLGFIESIRMTNIKDRIIPLIASMTFYFWAYQVAKGVKMPFLLNVLLLGNFWGIIALFIVSIFYKVSMHTTAAGGLLGIIIVLMIENPINMQVPFFIALLIAGMTGTARLILNAHSPGQVWLGYLIGILAQVGAYLFLL